MLRRKILSLKNLSLIENETIWKMTISINYCYGFMPGDFQIICGSMVGANHWSPASTKTPGL